MKLIILQLSLIVCFTSCKAQADFGTEKLKLEKIIEMPGVSGRIDHLAINLKEQKIYIAALGNNSIEVVDLRKAAIVHSIKGLDEPQGVAYITEHNEIAVANGGNGNCIFYNAADYSIITTLH